jgi:hypothetical protein
MSNSVKWNELAYFEALPVAAEPDYANGFTCDVCAIEFSAGPFYHNAKKGRDACLRCAVEAGVHYLPGAVCSLLLPSADTVESLSAAGGATSSPQRILCVLQFTTDSFAVVFGDDTSVTLYGKDPLTSGFTSALVPSAKGKRDRDGRLSRSSLVDAARGAASMSFSEAARRFPALRQLTSPAAVTGGKAFLTVVELCSPLQPPAVGSAPPPCLLWHNLTVNTASRDSDATPAMLNPKQEDDGEQASASNEEDLLAYSADSTVFSQLICVIVSRVLHAWHPPSGVEVLLDVSSQLGGSPLASRGGRAAVRTALEGCVRGVFQHGYAVTGWKAEHTNGKRRSPVPVASASVGACREKVHKILDGLARIVPWN